MMPGTTPDNVITTTVTAFDVRLKKAQNVLLTGECEITKAKTLKQS